jgi:hypothetical protein
MACFSDFFYEKKKEIQESPHYNKFAVFLHDLDIFYKDFTRNDAITNIQKYSSVVFDFIREKYFAVVPFGEYNWVIHNKIVLSRPVT